MYYPRISPAVLDKMFADYIIEPSEFPFDFPHCVVPKQGNTFRFYVDCRRLNKVSQLDAHPLSYVSSTLGKLRDASALVTLDIKSACWQIHMFASFRPSTAFTVSNLDLFQFNLP